MDIAPIKLQTGRLLGAGHPAYLIAEIGSNHDGDLSRAKKLLHLAKDAGADAAKFQSFTAEGLINRLSKQGDRWFQDPAWDILKSLSLPNEWHRELANEAKKAGIDFLSTPFGLERLELLLELDIPAIKIASGDLTYQDLLIKAAASGKPIFLSTGHATLGEVEKSVHMLERAGCRKLVLLQCASLYPSSCEDANIRGMQAMQAAFRINVGYSDHSPGEVVPLGAVALGACVIEKHFTDDCSRQGPDHSFALDPEAFAEMARKIRQLEAAIAWSPKCYREAEASERIMARRAFYAAKKIPRGTALTEDYVKCVRHAYPEGVRADQWDCIKGRIASEEIPEETLITWDKLS